MSQNRIVLRWEGGGEAIIQETDGVDAILTSTRQAAPGTPLRASVTLDSGVCVRFKVKQCRRLDAGTFSMKGRWIDLPKKMREEVLQALSGGTE